MDVCYTRAVRGFYSIATLSAKLKFPRVKVREAEEHIVAYRRFHCRDGTHPGIPHKKEILPLDTDLHTLGKQTSARGESSKADGRERETDKERVER